MTEPYIYYEYDGITLWRGDNREVLPMLPPRSIDLVLTDPPYAAAAATVTTGFQRDKWGGNWGDMSLVTLMASQTIGQPFLAHQHQVYWFCDQFSFAALVPFFFTRYALVQSIVWDKDILGVGGRYRKQTELIIYASTPKAPEMDKSHADLIRLRPIYADKQHPSEKPLPLIMQLAAATDWTCALDPYAGAGTTLVAAKALGRQAVGIEVDERYCEIIASRLQQQALPLALEAAG